ncbi:MAG: hypothetical protein ABJC89_11915 [Acidobacteriota bacterium]
MGSIELATFVLDAGDRTLEQTWKTLDLAFTDAELHTLARDGLAVRVHDTVNAAPKKVKIIVYDSGADLVGSLIVTVRWPGPVVALASGPESCRWSSPPNRVALAFASADVAFVRFRNE